MIALDVACSDLQISNIATVAYDSTAHVVTDVRVDDVDLVQIDLVQKHANSTVMIKV